MTFTSWLALTLVEVLLGIVGDLWLFEIPRWRHLSAASPVDPEKFFKPRHNQHHIPLQPGRRTLDKEDEQQREKALVVTGPYGSRWDDRYLFRQWRSVMPDDENLSRPDIS